MDSLEIASMGRVAGNGWSAALLMGLLMACWGCAPQMPAFAPPPPPEVTVAHPQAAEVDDTMEFTGVARGQERVELRARVKGFLQTKHKVQGDAVKAGDLLFTIDPRTYQAVANQAMAAVAARQKELDLADQTLRRKTSERQSNVISAQELDEARAARDVAASQVDLAKQLLRSAELDVEFCTIKAPIDGRLGFISIDEGQLVGATEPTLISTVINDSKAYATYEMDEPTLLQLRKRFNNVRPGEGDRPNVPVFLGLTNEEGFPHEGSYYRGDNAIDPTTGTIRLEAEFDNRDGTIVPGSFVRLQARLGTINAILVPDIAVLSDQQGRYVLVVEKTDDAADEVSGFKLVKRRAVEVGKRIGRDRVILSGLTTEDSVLVNGLQRAREGIKVKAVDGAT
jgi:membrane fusion protein, multidrug efflux system